MAKMLKNGGPDLKRAQRTGLSSRRAGRTKSRGPPANYTSSLPYCPTFLMQGSIPHGLHRHREGDLLSENNPGRLSRRGTSLLAVWLFLLVPRPCMSDYRCLLYDYPHRCQCCITIVTSAPLPASQCCMTIVTKSPAQCLRMCASLLTDLLHLNMPPICCQLMPLNVTLLYPVSLLIVSAEKQVTAMYYMPAVCCQLTMSLNVAVLLYLPTSAYPPPYYASGSLLLYCFRHWVHHPCPRPSACVWATMRKQPILLAKRYLRILQMYRLIEVKH